jgi:hypothetical protein
MLVTDWYVRETIKKKFIKTISTTPVVYETSNQQKKFLVPKTS